MSGPTYVRITADVTDVTAKLAIAKAEFANFNSDLRSMAQQMFGVGRAANTDFFIPTAGPDAGNAFGEIQ